VQVRSVHAGLKVLAFRPGARPSLSERRILRLAEHAASGSGDPKPTLIQHAAGTRFDAVRIWSGDLCCARKYVAYGSLARRASGRLRYERARQGGRRFRSSGRERNIFRLVLPPRPSRCGSRTSHSTRRTRTSKPARNSGRCVLDRIEAPHREARLLPPVAAPPALVETLQPARNMLRWRARFFANAPTFGRGQHSSERNIGRLKFTPIRGVHDVNERAFSAPRASDMFTMSSASATSAKTPSGPRVGAQPEPARGTTSSRD